MYSVVNGEAYKWFDFKCRFLIQVRLTDATNQHKYNTLTHLLCMPCVVANWRRTIVCASVLGNGTKTIQQQYKGSKCKQEKNNRLQFERDKVQFNQIDDL
jgi:hypothetical protein